MDTQEKYPCRAKELLEELELDLLQAELSGESFDKALKRLRKSSELTPAQQDVLGALAKCARKCQKRARKVRRKVGKLRAVPKA
jgi:hypothetical protein